MTVQLKDWHKPIRGKGGMQTLLRHLQFHADATGQVMALTPKMQERIRRYMAAYGDGGFQRRIGVIVGP